jgi:hypothetical protein
MNDKELSEKDKLMLLMPEVTNIVNNLNAIEFDIDIYEYKIGHLSNSILYLNVIFCGIVPDIRMECFIKLTGIEITIYRKTFDKLNTLKPVFNKKYRHREIDYIEIQNIINNCV